MDPRLRMQPGLVSDPSAHLLGRGGGMHGLSAYSLGLLQSQPGPEQVRQRDLAQGRAQANPHALHGAQGIGPSLSTGQGFYTVESLQGLTVPRQDGLLGPAQDAARSLGGAPYGGGGGSGAPQGLDAGVMNRLYAQQATNQKLVAQTPSAGVGSYLYPSNSVPVDANVNATALGRGPSNVGSGYGYPPYVQTDASLAAARYPPQGSLISSDAEILLRQRELQLQREREREKERERERERERDMEREREREKERSRAKEREREREREREWRHERERERERERRRERARREQIDRERRRELDRRREIDRRRALDKKRDADRRRERDREARAEKDKQKEKKEKRSSLASPSVDGDKDVKHTAIETFDKEGIKDSDKANEDNATKRKVNAKVNTRSVKHKSDKPDSKADVSNVDIKDNALLDKTNKEPEKVEAGVVHSDKTETDVITGKAEIEANKLCSGEKLNDVDIDEIRSKVEIIEQIGEEKTDEALKLEEIENKKGISIKSRVDEVDTGGNHTAVKMDEEVPALVLLDEKTVEVKNGKVEEKVVLNQDTSSGIPAQSKDTESVLGKRSAEVVGDSSSAKKTRQPKGKGVGAAATVQPGTVRCEVCKVTCRNATVYETHLKGEKHAERLKKAQEQAPITKSLKISKAADQAPSS